MRFFYAEGGFYAGITNENKATNTRFRLRLKAYVDQKNEFAVLQQLTFLFGVAQMYPQEVLKKKHIGLIAIQKKLLKKHYFILKNTIFVQKKDIVYAIWRKIVYSYFDKSYIHHLPKLEKRIQRIQLKNKSFKESKKVLPH